LASAGVNHDAIYLKTTPFLYGFSMPLIFGTQSDDIETQSQQYIKEARTFKVAFRYFACREPKAC
jgi:hypothetical protein